MRNTASDTVHKKRSDRKKEKDVSTQFERIIMVMGILPLF